MEVEHDATRSLQSTVTPKKIESDLLIAETVRESAKKLEEARRELNDTINRSYDRRSLHLTPVRD